MIEKAGRRGQRDEAVENSRFRGQFELKATSAGGVSCKVSGKKERNKRKNVPDPNAPNPNTMRNENVDEPPHPDRE
jgi:hypothetical protein